MFSYLVSNFRLKSAQLKIVGKVSLCRVSTSWLSTDPGMRPPTGSCRRIIREGSSQGKRRVQHTYAHTHTYIHIHTYILNLASPTMSSSHATPPIQRLSGSQVSAHPYAWPHNGSLSPNTTALVIIDMQKDCTVPASNLRPLPRPRPLPHADPAYPPPQSVRPADTSRARATPSPPPAP